MNYVLQMSTDEDIISTRVDDKWNPMTLIPWDRVRKGGLDIPSGATIVVVAHGAVEEIGNAHAGQVDINAEEFLALISQNMARGAAPGAIYLSVCAESYADFTTNVLLAAHDNSIWNNVALFGHNNEVSGPVPAPDSKDWGQLVK